MKKRISRTSSRTALLVRDFSLPWVRFANDCRKTGENWSPGKFLMQLMTVDCMQFSVIYIPESYCQVGPTITRRDQLKAIFCYRQTDGPEKEGRVALHKREKRFHNLTAIFAALKATNLGRWEIGSLDFGGSVAPRRCPHHSLCMCLLG